MANCPLGLIKPGAFENCCEVLMSSAQSPKTQFCYFEGAEPIDITWPSPRLPECPNSHAFPSWPHRISSAQLGYIRGAEANELRDEHTTARAQWLKGCCDCQGDAASLCSDRPEGRGAFHSSCLPCACLRGWVTWRDTSPPSSHPGVQSHDSITHALCTAPWSLWRGGRRMGEGSAQLGRSQMSWQSCDTFCQALNLLKLPFTSTSVELMIDLLLGFT